MPFNEHPSQTNSTLLPQKKSTDDNNDTTDGGDDDDIVTTEKTAITAALHGSDVCGQSCLRTWTPGA